MRCEVSDELERDAREFAESEPNEFDCDCCPLDTPDGPLHELGCISQRCAK